MKLRGGGVPLNDCLDRELNYGPLGRRSSAGLRGGLFGHLSLGDGGAGVSYPYPRQFFPPPEPGWAFDGEHAAIRAFPASGGARLPRSPWTPLTPQQPDPFRTPFSHREEPVSGRVSRFRARPRISLQARKTADHGPFPLAVEPGPQTVREILSPHPDSGEDQTLGQPCLMARVLRGGGRAGRITLLARGFDIAEITPRGNCRSKTGMVLPQTPWV